MLRRARAGSLAVVVAATAGLRGEWWIVAVAVAGLAVGALIDATTGGPHSTYPKTGGWPSKDPDDYL